MTANQNLSTQAADILVVDDTIASLRTMTEILTKAGYKPRPVEDPQLALEAAQAQPPSLILLAARMPKISGFEFCQRLKGDTRTRDVPIIFTSSLEDTEAIVQGFEMGGVDFITKPIQESEVLARVMVHQQLRFTQLHLETLVEERTARLQEEVVERKKIEAAFQTQINLFESLLEATPDTIEIVDPATMGYIKWNKALTELSGYSDEELAAMSSTVNFFDEADLRQVESAVEQAIREGAAIITADAILKDGSRLPMEFVVSLARDAEGHPLYLISIGRDITERKQAREALLASEEKYRDLVEKVNDVIYSIDIKGQITYLNPAIETLIGVKPEELLGQPIAQFLHPEDLEQMQKNIQALFSGQTPGSAEYRILGASGETRWIHVTSESTKKDGQITGIQGVLTDITENKRSEAQREQAAVEAERNRLARELHDSVTQSLYTTSLIAEALPVVWERQPEEARQSLEELRQLAQGALAEMRALLLELRPEALVDQPLSNLLHQLVTGITTRTNLPITITVTEEQVLPAEVQVAFYRIAQEALNNVIKHAQAAHAWVGLHFHPMGVTLRVKDDGLGFEIDKTKSQQLGMKIMQERAAEIGAELTITSQSGQGTEVLVNWVEES